MITFACTQNANLAIRMKLIQRVVNAGKQFCLRVEKYNADTSRYELGHVVVAYDEETIAKNIKAKIDFIETYLPTMQRIEIRN